MKKFVLIAIVFTHCSSISYSQTNSSYVDPAQMFNKLIIEKNSNSYYRISNYKVIGTPFFYGGGLTGMLYKKGQQGKGGSISYNTYDQIIEFISGTKSIEAIAGIDSFKVMLPDQGEATFISGEIYNTKGGYFQQVYQGLKYSLFKKYFSELAVVSTNYIQSDLREFDLNYEYYYADSSKAGLKKVKPKYAVLIKEFKDIPGLKEAIPQNFNENPEAELVKAFMYINK